MGLLSKLRNIVRVGKITGPANNNDQFPVQQLTFKGKVADTLMVFPYGVYANVSTDDALALFFSIDGNEENRAAIAYTPQKRPTDLANGEIAVYHPSTGTVIKFRNSGDLEVTSATAVTVTAPEVTIDGNATVTGALNVQGAVTFDTTLDVTGILTGGVVKNVAGTTLGTHVHKQGADGGGNAEQDTDAPTVGS